MMVKDKKDRYDDVNINDITRIPVHPAQKFNDSNHFIRYCDDFNDTDLCWEP